MDTRRMDSKRTMTMNWDELGSLDDDDNDNDNDDEDDDFFEANNRISAVVPMDFHSLEPSSDDEFEDPRMSFAERPSNVAGPSPPLPPPSIEEYDIWMAAPSSVDDRRRRLLHGIGLNSSKELVRLRTMAMSKKLLAGGAPGVAHLPPKGPGEDDQGGDQRGDHSLETCSPHDVDAEFFVRSRSDGDIDMYSIQTKRRKENLLGDVSKQRLTRTLSTFTPFAGFYKTTFDSSNSCSTSPTNNDHKEQKEVNKETKPKKGKKTRANKKNNAMVMTGGDQIGAFFLIKDLNTGKEFVVKEFAEDGMWNRLSDIQTGRQLTLDEFEKSVGYSPMVKELMRRENSRRHNSILRRPSINNISKKFSQSTKKGVSFIKRNINKKANSSTASTSEKEQNPLPPNPATLDSNPTPSSNLDSQKGGKDGVGPSQNNEWVKVRTQGKTYKELTALRFCQEIQAHQGPIWTIEFNCDGHYLASGGQDKVIHIWEVQECEVASLKPPEECGNGTPLHPMSCPSPDRKDKPSLAPDISTLEKKKKGRSGSRRGNIMPDYVKLPETVFTLSNEPVCSFEGHLDVVLDLSWSKTQLYLLSSSMDKTVRLWDLETKACLKLFAHNDYVTCIQFNPVNDEYFISGSLDAKIRIWSVPSRRVVDWTDLPEMVTAACYTPDGQGAAVGSHNGNCRMYNIIKGKLSQTIQFDIQNKKSTSKKITGFEFTTDNPNEVVVTSTDSRIRIYDGSEVVQKFRGFRNTNSQNAASLSPDGKYVVYGGDDSNVYVWKREEPKNGKTKTIIDTSSYESFQCKDVSVVISWPGSINFEPPSINLNNKKTSKKPPSSSTGSPKKEEVNMPNKKQLPPLPNNKKTIDKNVNSDKNNTNNENLSTSNNHKDDNNNNNNDNEKSAEGEKVPDSPEADPSQVNQTNSDSMESPSTSSNQSSTSASTSRTPGWNWFDGGGSHGSDTMQARAWGLVIVTAGLGGEIRAYQNFGVPLKVGRQFLA